MAWMKTVQVNQGCCSHIGRRKNQQDAYGFSDFEDTLFIDHGGVLAVVCDGIGGLEKGDEASRLAVKTLLGCYMAKTVDEMIPEALDKAVNMANWEVNDLAKQTGNDGNVGTTLVAAVVYQDELFWRSAGDSRIYLQRGDQLTQLSRDHTYAQELAQNQEANEMSPEDIVNHPDGNALVSYLGVGENMDVDQNKRPVKLQSGDVLLMCTDGVYNALSDAEMIEALQHPNAMKGALALQHKTLDKQLINQDNLTAIVLHARVPFIFSFVIVLVGYLVFKYLRLTLIQGLKIKK
jgi:PPM family protein phosphatase